MSVLRRYWFRFENEGSHLALNLGCGITALSYEDAIEILRQRVFHGEMPAVEEVIEDVDISTLDEMHIHPNMGCVATRGVWFPLGY
jgi:hypothetical protein